MNLNKTSLWERFCLLFVRPVYGVDWDVDSTNGHYTIIKIKHFNGITYVTDVGHGEYWIGIDKAKDELK